MTRLNWGTAGQRYFEAGADRGVLYVDGLGVAWNGLKTVTEAPSGGSPKPFYLDGIKYLNLSDDEEFEGTIEAFAAPFEFGVCDGEKPLYAGLSVTQQPRKPFGLSYRTLVGNDVVSLDFGYKIHIVYNALAQPAQRQRQSLTDSAEPLGLSWQITTTPPIIANVKPTAHLVIDTRMANAAVVSAIEDILYGTANTISRLPTPLEIINIFANPPSSGSTNISDNGDGTFSANGSNVTDNGDGTYGLSDSNITDNGDGTFATT